MGTASLGRAAAARDRKARARAAVGGGGSGATGAAAAAAPAVAAETTPSAAALAFLALTRSWTLSTTLSTTLPTTLPELPVAVQPGLRVTGVSGLRRIGCGLRGFRRCGGTLSFSVHLARSVTSSAGG